MNDDDNGENDDNDNNDDNNDNCENDDNNDNDDNNYSDVNYTMTCLVLLLLKGIDGLSCLVSRL